MFSLDVIACGLEKFEFMTVEIMGNITILPDICCIFAEWNSEGFI